TAISPLPLPDALPICCCSAASVADRACGRLSPLVLRGRETVELIVRDGSFEPAVIRTALEQLDRSALQQPHRRIRGTRTEADSCDAQFLEFRDGGKALPNHDVDREPQCSHE